MPHTGIKVDETASNLLARYTRVDSR